MWQLMLRICQSILLGDRGSPFSLKTIMCFSNSHMRHQSLAQPDIQGKIRQYLKKCLESKLSIDTHLSESIYIYIYIYREREREKVNTSF